VTFENKKQCPKGTGTLDNRQCPKGTGTLDNRQCPKGTRTLDNKQCPKGIDKTVIHGRTSAYGFFVINSSVTLLHNYSLLQRKA
jgi:hypothetical protein